MSLLLKILIVLSAMVMSMMGIRLIIAISIVKPKGLIDILGAIIATLIAFLFITVGLVGFFVVTSHGDISRLFQINY